MRLGSSGVGSHSVLPTLPSPLPDPWTLVWAPGAVSTLPRLLWEDLAAWGGWDESSTEAAREGLGRGREVEDVVDEREQRVAGVMDAAEVFRGGVILQTRN